MLRIRFESQVYDGSYLCLDSRGPGSHERGYGSVSLSSDPSGSKKFLLVMNNPARDTVYIRSVEQANTFLRLDGTPPVGIVNCQKRHNGSTLEEFRIVAQGDGSVLIESVAFPGHFLRAQGDEEPPKVSVQNWEEGGGIESDERRFRVVFGGE